MYAAEHNMTIDKVTPQMVKSSELGLEYYACKGLDTSARGVAGQALNRAMDKSPHVKHEIYKWLSEDLKKKFRTSWAIERSFEKVAMDKSPHVKHEIYKWLSEDLKKKFRTSWAIERSFEKEIVVDYNKWTKAENFLLVEKLSSGRGVG
eukprot:s11787_g1.t1